MGLGEELDLPLEGPQFINELFLPVSCACLILTVSLSPRCFSVPVSTSPSYSLVLVLSPRRVALHDPDAAPAPHPPSPSSRLFLPPALPVSSTLAISSPRLSISFPSLGPHPAAFPSLALSAALALRAVRPVLPRHVRRPRELLRPRRQRQPLL